MGGVDKARLKVADERLLDRALAAAPRARQAVVVGPADEPGADGIDYTMEDPPGGGPAAGVAAGLAQLGTPAPWVLVLAVDQPRAGGAVTSIVDRLAHLPGGVDAVCHRDSSGHPQWLLAAYRTAALRRALAALDSTHGVAMRRAVAPLCFEYLFGDSDYLGDIDTWEDHARWEARLRGSPAGPSR